MASCKTCKTEFSVHPDGITFRKKMEFQFGASTVSFPEPDNCPDCRNQIRTAHRNERFLYHRKSDKSGKSIVALYQQKTAWGHPYTIYSPEEWHSDAWDGLDYGRDFDFKRPFFEQFAELQKKVPRQALVTISNENSPYTTGTGY